nr:hypothetical protein [uncultured Albidiferax sp.]
MHKSVGLTEIVWSSLSEDQRLAWKYFSRAIAAIGAFFVVKTGNIYFDWALGIATTTFLVIAVETQRSYSKLRPRFRKGSIRVAMALGTWGVSLLGSAMFMQAGLAASATVFSSDVGPHLSSTRSSLSQIVLLVAFVVAVPVAMINVFRQLRIAELIFHLPRQGLKQLFVRREPKVVTFPQFAHMELSVLAACLIYASSVASIYNVVSEVVQLVIHPRSNPSIERPSSGVLRTPPSAAHVEH